MPVANIFGFVIVRIEKVNSNSIWVLRYDVRGKVLESTIYLCPAGHTMLSFLCVHQLGHFARYVDSVFSLHRSTSIDDQGVITGHELLGQVHLIWPMVKDIEEHWFVFDRRWLR